jgi:hypothetical protein
MPIVNRFDTLPDSMKPFTAEEKKHIDKICGYAKTWAAKSGELGAALEKAAGGGDALERKSAVTALGAVDDLPRLVNVLKSKAPADARDMAILVLRHWLGSKPGQSIRLNNYLIKTEGYTPTQAKNLIHLCNGIVEEKARQPQTYDLLIMALNHAKQPTRELAHWHLIRLAPAGKDIPYDAAAPEAARTKAVEAWRQLIPEGQLPPPPKKTSTKDTKNTK